MPEGIGEELRGIDLGDKRRNKRSQHVLETLAENPEASINGACGGWGDTVAAYRFFDNAAVTPEEILRPHREAAMRRMREHPVVLLVQDTSELDFSQHPPRDARYLDHAKRLGLYAHTHLAVTPDKLALGVVGIDFFDRSLESLGRSGERVAWPIEQKESFRWVAGFRRARELAAELPEQSIVSVADREADLYDIFVEAQEQSGSRAEYVIRAKVARSTPKPNPAAGKAAYCKVRDEVAAAPLLATETLELGATPKRTTRTAVLELRARTVLVKPPHARPHLPPVTLNVVLAQEVDGPHDGTAVSWLLITSLPIGTIDEVRTVIDYYVARWTVEIFFRTWKTGCRIEEIQLETQARLKNCLAMYAIVAWHLLYLTYLNRTRPTLPCTTVLTASEWKSVWLVAAKKPLPTQPPTLAEMLRLIAQLGGYNNRKGEAPPGPQPLWIGLRRMADFAQAWLTFAHDTGQHCV